MFKNAPYAVCCRRCGGQIETGEPVSWLKPGQPYHLRCVRDVESIENVSNETTKSNVPGIDTETIATKSKFQADYIALITATLIAEGLVVGAIGSHNSPGYYILLRIVVFLLSGFFAFRLFFANHTIISVVAGFTAILYNPVLLIHLPYDTWQNINVATVILLFVALYLLRPRRLLLAPLFEASLG